MADDLRLPFAALPDDAASDADIPDIGSPEERESFDIAIPPELEGERLDVAIARLASLTRSAAQRAIENGGALKGGKALKKNYRVSRDEIIRFTLPPLTPSDVEPEDIPLDIVYEDGDLIVVNKPKGMVVHPAAGNYTGTMAAALMWHCLHEGASLSSRGGDIRPGIVHRIDKDTSGLLVVAKNDKAHNALAEQIKAHTASRRYEAICSGHFREDTGTVDAPLGRHPSDRVKMAVITDPRRFSRAAVTHWRVISPLSCCSHIECRLETGRTHQIRVHMDYIGHHVMCDPVYGMKGATEKAEKRYSDLAKGQCLVARTLGFVHPMSGEYMEFTAPLPDYFRELLRIWGGEDNE